MCSYILFVLHHHTFISLNLVCRPVDVIYGFQLQRLLLASLVHTSLPGLCLALLICWRRFAWLERRAGTLGFVVWFIWCSLIVHSIYCLGALVLAAIVGAQGPLDGEVHGLLPLLTANLVASIKGTDASTVWLWPFPLHVPVRAFPIVVVAMSWSLHFEAHLDVIAAYAVASIFPSLLDEPGTVVLDMVEQVSLGKLLVVVLQSSDAFVCRPPPDSVGELSSARSVGGATPERQPAAMLQPHVMPSRPDLPSLNAASVHSTPGEVATRSAATTASLSRASSAGASGFGRPPLKVGSIKSNPFILADSAVTTGKSLATAANAANR